MAMALTVENELIKHRCSYSVLGHEHTGSSRETAAAAHIPSERLLKAVVLSDPSGYVMAVVPGNHYVGLKRVRAVLNRPLELVQEQMLTELFKDCEQGAVPPLGPAYGMETLVDEHVMGQPDVYLEAGDHQELVHLDTDEFLSLVGSARVGKFSES